MDCPCGSGRPLKACCDPIIAGRATAATAEALMRARYTAFATRRPDFVIATVHPDQRDPDDAAQVKRWSREGTWHGLEIRAVQAGGEGDEEGMVEFVARYSLDGEATTHHERATFRRHEGAWRLWDGALVGPAPVRRTTPKVGRNDPCPCGSGRKYKQCHGRQAAPA